MCLKIHTFTIKFALCAITGIIAHRNSEFLEWVFGGERVRAANSTNSYFMVKTKKSRRELFYFYSLNLKLDCSNLINRSHSLYLIF